MSDLGKYAFIILTNASDRDSAIKVDHAISYAVELKSRGHEATIYFDGAGSKLAALEVPDDLKEYVGRSMKKAEDSGVIYGVCGYCASPSHLNVIENMTVSIEKLVGDENNHVGVVEFADKGYNIIIV